MSAAAGAIGLCACRRPPLPHFPPKFKPQFSDRLISFSNNLSTPQPISSSFPQFASRGPLSFRQRRGAMSMSEGEPSRPAIDALRRAGDYFDDGEGTSVREEEELLRDGSSQIASTQLARPTGLVPTLNRLSKWLVTVLFVVLILWRHDAEALWAALGSILNTCLSVLLKRILNQQRPNSALKSDPGMPSSHAQSIFYFVAFAILSVVEWLGINDLTLVLSFFALAIGAYMSWLRVAERYHTMSQVVVGAIVGLGFAYLWLWWWKAFVSEAFDTFLWVRVTVLLGFCVSGLGFLVFVIRNWLYDDKW